MRFQVSLLCLLAWLSSSVLAALTSEQLFGLQAQQGSNGAIWLNDDNFDLLMSGARDYYTAILFTSTAEEINCAYCQKFHPHYIRTASSYYESNPGKDAIFFFVAEFTDNQQHYGKLQMTQVPRLWVFPPNSTESADILSPHYPYTIGESAITDILDFASFIGKIVGANIVISAEFDLQQFLTYSIGTFVFVLVLKKKVLSKLGRAVIIEIMTLLATVVFISGYMFTVIRGIPLIAKNEHGEIMWYSGGTHWQFGLEVFIVGAIYLTQVGFIYALVVKIPKIENDKKRGVLTFCVAFGIFYVFNRLTWIFEAKDPGYPFKLTSFEF